MGRVGLEALVLPLLILVAAALRLSDLNWDSGHLFHPDERHILMVTDGLRVPWPLDLDLLLSRESPLNPKSFAYGSLIFYLLKFLQWVALGLAGVLGMAPQPETWLEPGLSGLRYFGRAVSALVDTGTVYLTYRLGTTLYSRRVGMLAAAFTAFSVLHIQLSHFYASDTPMTFFVTLTLLMAAYLVKWGRRRHALAAGVSAGLALACKFSASPVLGAVAAAHVLRYALPSDDEAAAGAPRRLTMPDAGRLSAAIGLFLVGLLATAIVFVLFQPYALIDFKTFSVNLAEQNAMVRGIADLPYTRQYIDRPAYWYFVENLALFGVGLPLGLAIAAGWLFVVVRAIREPRRADLLLLAFVLPYFAITGSFHAKFIRYLLPMMPAVSIFAAVGLVALYELAVRRRPAPTTEWAEVEAESPAAVEAAPATAEPGAPLLEPVAAPVRQPAPPAPSVWGRAIGGLIAFVVVTTGLYALAYQHVYAGEHTAVEASRWIYANVPRGSTLANEHWEEGIPVAVRVDEPNRRQLDPGVLAYKQVPLNLYEQDDERKLQHIASTLATTDYVLFFSNRLYGTVPRLPARYPMTTRYYQLLFGEQLGFQLVAAFDRYPELAGVALVDDTLSEPRLPTPALLQQERPAALALNLGRADEAFSVYDHPKVLVFKKVQPISQAEVRAQLLPALQTLQRPGAAPATAAARTYKSLLLTPAQALRNELGGAYNVLFDRDGLVNRLPLVVWALLLAVIGLAAVPIAVLAFPRLEDGGLPLARTLGLLATTWFTWIVVSLGALPAGRAASYLGLIGLIALGVLCWRRAWPRLIELWRTRRAALIGGELAFWVPFVYFVLVRMANPDLWHPARGGEKPMDFAYLMAAIRSSTFPPYDPWFAGGYLNYYYFGQVICANLIKLSGVVPTSAYNLVVPTLYAATFAGAFTVGYNLCRRRVGVDERVAVGGGLLAGFFVTTIGNLRGPIQIGESLVRMSETSYQSLLPGAQYLILAGAGLFNWVVNGRRFEIGTDWYWAASRSIQGSAITEFPYFTFLFADLHAHLIALPFALLTMGLALNLLLTPTPRLTLAPLADARLFAVEAALPRLRTSAATVAAPARAISWPAPEAGLRVVLTALALGALLPINAWDFPTYVGMIAVCGLAPWYLSSWRDLNGLLASLVRVGTIVILSYVLYLPFHQNFVSFYSGVKPTPEQSDLGGYLVVHGFFLFVLLSYLAIDAAGPLRRTGFLRTLGQVGRRWDRFPHMLELRARLIRRDDSSAALVVGGLAAMTITFLLGALIGFAVAGLLVALLIPTVWRLLARPRSPDDAFLLLLLATGLAIELGVELIVIDGDIGRMNTVFKFYLQVWCMWAIATAVALVAMRDRLQAIRRGGAGRWWAGAVLLLLIATCFYPLIATRARIADRFDRDIGPTLDGTAYMQSAVYQDGHREALRPSQLQLASDLHAIEWLWDNVPGSPVIAEGNAPLYSWGSRVSIYTGLPTIIGWDWHQTQQRFGFRNMVEERMRDVRTLFADPSPQRALEILSRYHVRYVYVGELERAYYPEVGLRKFDEMVGRDLELVYDQDRVRIYRVLGEAE
jgi:YYY domain-containing protein